MFYAMIYLDCFAISYALQHDIPGMFCSQQWFMPWHTWTVLLSAMLYNMTYLECFVVSNDLCHDIPGQFCCQLCYTSWHTWTVLLLAMLYTVTYLACFGVSFALRCDIPGLFCWTGPHLVEFLWWAGKPYPESSLSTDSVPLIDSD